MATALDVGRFFILLSGLEDESEPMTHLRLQKLLYYAQGWSLGMSGKPLFEDKLQGWVHGPVVPNVYHVFKKYGDSPIPSHVEGSAESIDRKTAESLYAVWGTYKIFSPLHLRSMTHAEAPWMGSRNGLARTDIGQREISTEEMCKFFSSRMPVDAQQ